ncbi:MAG: TonB family protein [Acidobacteria bacterium]|nr:TonB family protein [Acidobacteriota bacterium]
MNAAAPIHSEAPPTDNRFRTFGVLPEMHQSKGSTVSSIVIMSIAVALIIILGSQAKKIQQKMNLTKLEAPIPIQKEDIPKPKPVIKELPKPPKLETPQPKIELPKIEMPEPPKIQTPVMKAEPIPVPMPAPPKAVTPPPAPVQIAINRPQAASTANNNPHPTAIRTGSMTNPIHNTSGPAVSPINMGRAGAPGMPAGNTGLGPASKINIAGSGAPNGKMGGTANAPHAIAGVRNGAPGGTGPMNARPTGVQIVQAHPPAVAIASTPSSAASRTAPKVTYKPPAPYTEEAKAAKIQGVVQVKIHVSETGHVSVLGIVGHGLGHGLNESALHCAQGMRMTPAMENGHPVPIDTVVTITFQLAS